MRFPDILGRINELLTQSDLPPVSEADFSTRYRLIYASWAQLQAHPELELADFLPLDMLELVQGWSAQTLPEVTLPSQWEHDVQRTVLRIRERELRQQLQQAHNTLSVAQMEQDSDAVLGIRQRIKELSDDMWRIQRALAKRPVQV